MRCKARATALVKTNSCAAGDADEVRVTLVSINYAPELTGIAVYSTGLAEYLARAGRRLRVITGFPYYPAWRKADADRAVLFRREGTPACAIWRCYLYVPRRPGVLHRILHELSFVLSAGLAYALAPRAHFTLIVSPPLLLGIPIALLARLKGSRVLFHVQDLQPDAALELGMLPAGPVARVLLTLERWSYRLAHCVSAISPGMLERIERKGVRKDKLMLLRNWANDDLVRPLPPQASMRADWNLQDRFVLLYAGNLGVKQGLEQLLEVARLLRDDPDITLLMVGDGGEKEALMARARDMDLPNVVFKALQPVHKLAALLACADVALIPQRAGMTDIVLPSKLPNLMASERPLVVMADAGTELHAVVLQSGCGVAVASGDAGAMAGAVRALRASPEARRRHGANGREFVLARLSRESILGEFDRWLAEWLSPPPAQARRPPA